MSLTRSFRAATMAPVEQRRRASPAEQRSAQVTVSTAVEQSRAGAQQAQRQWLRTILWVWCILCGLTILLELTDLNLLVSQLFYLAELECWPFWEAPVLLAFDRFAPIPGLVLGIGGLVWALGRGVLYQDDHAWRTGLFLALTLAVGPGLVVNGMKGIWGRPRPHDLEIYGRHYEYHPVWKTGTDCLNCKSFPSGHAAMGFYMMTPMFLYMRRNHALYRLWLIGGFGYGLLVSWSRIIQGAHFISDVMWAAGLVYLTGLLLEPLILRSQSARD